MSTVSYNAELEKILVENGYNVAKEGDILRVQQISEKNAASSDDFLANLCKKKWKAVKGRNNYEIHFHPDYFIFDGEVTPQYIIVKTK